MKFFLCIMLIASMLGLTMPVYGSTEGTSKKTYVPRNSNKEEIRITLSFVGDCTLATYDTNKASNNFENFAKNKEAAYFFEGVAEILKKDDYSIANCEVVLSNSTLSKREKNEEQPYYFKGLASNASIFKEGGIEAVTIANNHINDYGKKGKAHTIDALNEYEILSFGENDSKIVEIKGVKLGLIGWGLWVEGQVKTIVQEIERLKLLCDLVIVYYHGGTEGIHNPDEYKVNGSRRFIEAGASLVVGSHPHVLQPIEEYKGRHIVYSLGNFVYGGSFRPKNRTIVYQETFVLEKSLEGLSLKEVSQTVIPCRIYSGSTNEFHPTLLTDEEEMQRVYDFLDGRLALPY